MTNNEERRVFSSREVVRASPWLAAALGSTLVMQSGCSSIDRTNDLHSQHLAARVSTKADAVGAIGLPQRVERDEVQGVEIWLYTGKPISTSYFVPVPIAVVPSGQGFSTVYYMDAGRQNLPSNAPVVLVLVFDRSGQLLEVQDGSK